MIVDLPFIWAMLIAFAVECRSTGGTEAITHGGVAEIERRIDGKQVAADIATDVEGSHLALQHFEGSENRPLRTAGAKSGRPRDHGGGQFLQHPRVNMTT